MKRFAFTIAALTILAGTPSLHFFNIVETATAQTFIQPDKFMDAGEKLLEDEKYEAALKAFNQALAIYRKNGDRRNEFKVYLKLSEIYSQLNSFSKAVEVVQSSIAIAKELKDLGLEAQAIVHQGHISYDQKQWDRAFNSYKIAAAMANQAGDRQTEIVALENEGAMYNMFSNFNEAIRIGENVILLSRELKNNETELSNIDWIGKIQHEGLKEPLKAIATFQELSNLSQKYKDNFYHRLALIRISNIHWDLGDYDKAVDGVMKAIEIARKDKDYDFEGHQLFILGNAYGKLGNMKKTLEFLRQAVKAFELAGDRDTAKLIQDGIKAIQGTSGFKGTGA